jgi:hypothetical protein
MRHLTELGRPDVECGGDTPGRFFEATQGEL